MIEQFPDWRSAMAGVSADIDDEFGEALVVTPCKAEPNRQAEPCGPSVEVRGTFRWRASGVLHMERGQAIESRMPIATFDRHALPFAPHHEMRVARKLDGNLFEVREVEPDGVSRIVCRLVQLGLADPT